MKKLFLILLIALTTCAIFEENFDDDVVLEKKKHSITTPVKTKKKKITTKVTTKHTTKVTTKHTTGGTTGHTTGVTTGITTGTKKIPTRPSMKELLKIKGINGLFKGKVGEIFRKLKEIVKKGIAWLKQKGLFKDLVGGIRQFGEKYGNEYCQKILPSEVCGPAVDFILNSVLGTPEEEQA